MTKCYTSPLFFLSSMTLRSLTVAGIGHSKNEGHEMLYTIQFLFPQNDYHFKDYYITNKISFRKPDIDGTTSLSPLPLGVGIE